MNAHLVQGSPEWFAARLGKMTASEAGVVMGSLKSDGIAQYVKDLAWERVYGAGDESFRMSRAMKRGKQLEAQARAWYEFETDTEVEQVGVIDHPRVPWAAASPDGRVPGIKVLEIKCPQHREWMEMANDRRVPAEYRWQTRWQQWCTELHACDFVAYHPVAGGVIVPCEVTAAEIEQMTERAYQVNVMVGEWVERLRARKAA